MSIKVTATVTGAVEVKARLQEQSSRTWERVKRAVEKAGIELQKDVMLNQLTGNALRVRTGRLRRSITQEFTADGLVARSTVGTNVAYGRFWELGFHGVQNVGSYLRKNKGRACGMGAYKAHLRYREGQIATKGYTGVRAHQRRVNQDPRPFLKPEAEAMRGRVRSLILKAIGEGGSVT